MICAAGFFISSRAFTLLDLLDLLFNLGGEHLYLVLLLRDGCLQVLKFEIKHGLLGGVGNSLGLDAFGRFTGISARRSRSRSRSRSSKGHCAQSSIGIDEHHTGNRAEVVNVRTIDVADIADVIFLAKATVHTRMVADDDIIIDDGDPRPGHCAYGNMSARAYTVLERRTTDACIVESAGVA